MRMMTKLALSTAALTFGMLAIPAAAQTKEAPPAPAEARPFTLPNVTNYELPNGTKVTLVPYGRTPQVTVLAAVRTGNIDDGDNIWLADMTGQMMEKGAGGHTGTEMAEMAADMGGSLSLGVGADLTTAYTGVLSEHAADAVKLIADLLIRPDFPADEVEKVRADLLRGLSVAQSTPGGIAGEAFSTALYPDHPYGRDFPTAAQLSSYTLDQLRSFHARNFGAQRTHLYIVGQFDDAAIRKAVEEGFGKWAKGTPPTVLAAPAGEPGQVVLIDRPGAPQSTLNIGQRVEVPVDDVKFAAANTLLGGYFSSRITRNIREDKGYTYSPGSAITRRVHAAGWGEYADVTAEATGPSITEILKEVRLMQTQAPSAAEVQGIKNYMNGVFVLGLASRGGVASRLANLDMIGLGPDYLNTYVEKVTALTGEDMRAATAQYLPVDKMTYVVVGPLDSVRPQLEAVPELAGRLPTE